MAARDQLIAYGYKRCPDGKYRRPGKNTQVWQELEDGRGWARFDCDGQGNEVPEVYQVNEAYLGTSGLSKLHHPGAFDWIYPEAYVEEIYRVAVASEAEWLHAAMGRKGQFAAIPTPVAVPTATEAQLASMQNAQAVAAKKEKAERKKHWWR